MCGELLLALSTRITDTDSGENTPATCVREGSDTYGRSETGQINCPAVVGENILPRGLLFFTTTAEKLQIGVIGRVTSRASPRVGPNTNPRHNRTQKMSKRARTSGGSVTGGTGDIKPQQLTLSTGIAGAADDYVVNRVALPVPRFGTMKTKATIFEILAVDWYLAIENVGDGSAQEWGFLTTSTARVDAETSTLASAVVDVADPKTFAFVLQSRFTISTGAGTEQMPIHINMTDDNGNGFLVATDQLFIVGGGVANGAAGSFVAKVYYRLTNVGIQEYVGIVQSQQ